MRKKLLAIFYQKPGKLIRLNEIYKKMNVNQENTKKVKSMLNNMVKKGELSHLKRKGYALPNNLKLLNGKLIVTQKGFGFVTTEHFSEDIFVDRKSIGDAIHGDTVEVKLNKNSRSQEGLKGSVNRVVKRKSDSFIGITYNYLGKIFISISPVNPGRGIQLIKAKKDLGEGQIVKAKVKDWGDAFNPIIAELDVIIGQANDPVNDLAMILNKYDFQQGFPKKVVNEVKQFSQHFIEKEIVNRLDFRDLNCFTIDPEDAKDFDDAISIQQNGDEFVLGVHIADVSHFVKPNSFIDREAMVRGNSAYFHEGVVHMIPEQLSADLCSLKPDEDRLTISVMITLDKAFSVIKSQFLPSVIRSKARFTYNDVQKFIMSQIDHPLKSEINTLKKLAMKLYNIRSKAGSIDFDIPEPVFDMTDESIPHVIRPSERLESHRIVEECMLLANKVVATQLPKLLPKRYPFLFRIHAKPDKMNEDRFKDLIRLLRINFKIPKGDFSPRDFKNILKHVEDSPFKTLIENIALRSMSKAEYSLKNIGHFGLAFDNYTHFTSPIRRYSDLIIHRLIKMVCDHSFEPKLDMVEIISKAVDSSNRAELKALNAEREYIKMKQLRWLNKRVGESFEGIISGVVNFGFFVQLDLSLAEGLVHINSLGDDQYFYDADHYCIRGRQYAQEFRLGNKVKVKLLDVLFEKQRANFILDNN